MFDSLKPIDLLSDCEFLEKSSTVRGGVNIEGILWWKKEVPYIYVGETRYSCKKLNWDGYCAEAPCTIADQARCPLVDRV